MTINAKMFMRWLVPLAMTLAAGCAPAYHSYSDCYVDCQYCAPPPLPYTHYDDCVCHSCAAEKYLSLPPQPVKEEGEGTYTDEQTE